MEEEKKKLPFCSYFRHISLWFYSNFISESSLAAEFNSTSNEYPLGILLTGPTTPKTRNTWKNVMKFYIQRVPTRHTFDGTRYPKIRNTWKNVMMMSSSRFFQVFLVFGIAESIKSIHCEYSLDANFNFASNELSQSKFE